MVIISLGAWPSQSSVAVEVESDMILSIRGRPTSRILASLIIIGVVLAATLNPSLFSVEAAEDWGTVVYYLPAVDDGGERGRLIKTELRLTKNPGFKVIAGGEVDPTTENSMKMAFMVALLLSGISWRGVGAEIRIESQGPVAGPSGSLATAVATIQAVSAGGFVDIPREYGIVVTGAVTPGGLAAQVGGIPAKCSAANNEGYELVLPLVNKGDAPRDCDFVGVASVWNVLELMGWPDLGLAIEPTLPKEFNDSMLDIAEFMRSEAERLLEESRGIVEGDLLLDAERSIAESIERSINAEGESPYAAASFAFGALLTAYQLYYSSMLASGGSIDSIVMELERELEGVRAELDSMKHSGSVLYVEMLAVAYTRLANAESSLTSARISLEGGAPPEEVVVELGYVKARLESVKGWLSTAKSVEGLGREISIEELRIIVDMFREYSEVSMDYGKSLVRYMIEVYGMPEARFRPYLAALETLRNEAARYIEENNYVAALGFYRDGVTRTLQVISSAPTEALAEEDLKTYFMESQRIASLLISRASSLGFQSGLAMAYMEYADILNRLGQGVTALSMMEEAVASSILWALAAEALEDSVERGSLEPGQGSPNGTEELASGIFFTIALVLSTLFFILGVYLSSRSFSRSIRIWM